MYSKVQNNSPNLKNFEIIPTPSLGVRGKVIPEKTRRINENDPSEPSTLSNLR